MPKPVKKEKPTLAQLQCDLKIAQETIDRQLTTMQSKAKNHQWLEHSISALSFVLKIDLELSKSKVQSLEAQLTEAKAMVEVHRKRVEELG